MKALFTTLICLQILAIAFIPGKEFKASENHGVKLQVTTPAFSLGGMIPEKFSCKGQNINPAITVTDVPTTAISLAIIVDDPDAPKGIFTHWVAWDMPAHGAIMENNSTGTQGQNGMGGKGYTGPCPPSGIHRYFFKVFALDKNLDLPLGSTKATVEAAMKGHIVGEGELMGKFSK